MKKVILLVAMLPYMAFGQIVENFESGNLNNWVESDVGRWKADTSQSISGRYSLHHIYDNADAGTDQTGIVIDSLHPTEGTVKWSFKIRHGYDPSSSNNWALFLMSDAGPSEIFTNGNTNGYAVGVNLTGYDDTLRLWKVKGTVVTVVASIGVNWQSMIGTNNPVSISVERTIDGRWNVSLFQISGDMLGTSSGLDNELFSCRWLVLSYKYSSSRDRLLWFDDLSVDGIFYHDNRVPAIVSCAAADKNSIKIVLSDQPDDSFLLPDNFSLHPEAMTPASVLRESDAVYSIKFAAEFVSRSDYILSIHNLCNRNGNCSKEVQVPFTPVWPETGDIVISEIMADPEPEVSLPPREYIEITNRTGNLFNLKNWKLGSGDQLYIFPETIIDSFESLIICSIADTSEFSRYGRVIGLKPFPALTDNGKVLVLYDSADRLIHGIEYSAEWYGDELKSDGGWALEMIDTGYPFNYDGNWTASRSKSGGTPGKVNSVRAYNPDNSFSGDLIVFPPDSLNITIRSPEPLFNLSGMSDSIYFDDSCPSAIYPTDPLYRQFSVRLKHPLGKGRLHQFDYSGDISDFAGNRLIQKKKSFGLTETASRGDILFNELLFNSLPGDPDYVELYNASAKIIDVSRLELVSVNMSSGDTSQIYPVSDLPQCLLPGEYYAITTDMKKVELRYFSGNPDFLSEVASLPSMPDDKGHLILFSRELVKIDEVSYSEKMHSSLLAGYDGVALEKISPGKESEDPGNWHSASGSSGWGTPGARNSVYSEMPPTLDMVSLSSTKITPNDDGIEDMLLINFNLTGNSNIVSVTIYDESGNYVRRIAENIYAGPEASLVWDGVADDGSMVDTGIYIVFISMFDDSGKTHKWKKVCTVLRR